MSAFLALSDPTRRRIVDMLSAGPMPSGEIASRFELSAPAVSQHLRVLREAHIVAMRVDAQRRIYQLDATGLREVDTWLSRHRKVWTTALDGIDAQLRTGHPVEIERKNRKKRKSGNRKKAKSKKEKSKGGD